MTALHIAAYYGEEGWLLVSTQNKKIPQVIKIPEIWKLCLTFANFILYFPTATLFPLLFPLFPSISKKFYGGSTLHRGRVGNHSKCII